MICLVKGPQGNRLIRAKSNAAAINHCVDGLFESRAVSSEELVDLLDEGMVVETASAGVEDRIVSDDSAATVVSGDDDNG